MNNFFQEEFVVEMTDSNASGIFVPSSTGLSPSNRFFLFCKVFRENISMFIRETLKTVAKLNKRCDNSLYIEIRIK